MAIKLNTRPGQLRHRLVLEAPVFAADGGGGTARSWETSVILWAQIIPLSPAPDVDAERPGGQVRYRVICRHRTEVKVGQRFRNGPQYLGIEAVFDPDGTARWLECRCREHQP